MFLFSHKQTYKNTAIGQQQDIRVVKQTEDTCMDRQTDGKTIILAFCQLCFPTVDGHDDIMAIPLCI